MSGCDEAAILAPMDEAMRDAGEAQFSDDPDGEKVMLRPSARARPRAPTDRCAVGRWLVDCEPHDQWTRHCIERRTGANS